MFPRDVRADRLGALRGLEVKKVDPNEKFPTADGGTVTRHDIALEFLERNSTYQRVTRRINAAIAAGKKPGAVDLMHRRDLIAEAEGDAMGSTSINKGRTWVKGHYQVRDGKRVFVKGYWK